MWRTRFWLLFLPCHRDGQLNLPAKKQPLLYGGQKFKTFDANEQRYQNTNGTNIGTRVSFDKPYKTNKPKLLYQGYVECCTSMLEGNSNEISL
jgi:hypothetical protein